MRRVVKVMGYILVGVAIIMLGGVIFLHSVFPPVLSQEETEKDFFENKDSILLVTDYLIHCEENNVFLLDFDSEDFAAVEEVEVVNAIRSLYNNGYSAITKYENMIKFQRSTRFRDFGSGVVYSIEVMSLKCNFLLNWRHCQSQIGIILRKISTNIRS